MGRRIGVIVLDFDQQPLTLRCLRSMADGARHPDLVVVVENGLRELDLRDLAMSCLPIVVLRAGRNLGCAGGRNLALNYLIRNTDLATFVVLDNDCVVFPDFVAEVAQLGLPPLRVVAPIILDFSTGEVWSSGGIAEADGTVHQLAEWIAEGPFERDWAPGACLIMARETWIHVGLFDTDMNPFLFEDIDWCRRVRDAGGSVLVDPRLKLLHEAHQSLGGKWSPERVRLWARNGTIYRAISIRARASVVARWLVNETALAGRDLANGKICHAVARISGLNSGIWLSAKRLWREHFCQDK